MARTVAVSVTKAMIRISPPPCLCTAQSGDRLDCNAGVRHRLAHGYYKVNLDVIWMAVERDVPQLIAPLDQLRP